MLPSPDSPDLQSILLDIIEVRPLAPVLRSLAQAALRLTGADYAALGAYDEEHRLDSFEVFGISPAERAAIGHPPHGVGLLGEFARHPITVNVRRAEEHEAFSGFPPGHPPMEAFLGVPIVYAGRPIGAFYITRRPGGAPFTTADEQQLETLAPYAAIAIANARTFEQQQRRPRAAETLAETARGLQSAADEQAAAQLLVHGIREAIPGPTHWQSRIELGDAPLAPAFERQLYLVSRELISNVERHAEAGKASFSLLVEDGEVQLDVVDDGRGFDRGAVREDAVGLRSLEQRVDDFGGSALVESTPGPGTRVTVRAPLPPPAED